jgi:hypothetical protein
MIRGFLVSPREHNYARTHCQLDLASGRLYPEPSDIENAGAIRSQYFEDYEANSFSVCPECNRFVTRRTVVCGQEAIACSDPECPSWAEPGLYAANNPTELAIA